MVTSNSDFASQVIGGLEVHLNTVKKNAGIVSDSESLREMGSVIKLDSQITQEVRDDCPTVVYDDHSPKFLGLPGNDLGTLVNSAQEMEVKMQDSETQQFSLSDGTSTPVNRNPHWFDSAADGNRSKLSDISDSLLVTKVRADLGLSDLGDQISVGHGSDRARGDRSLSPVGADLTQSAQETRGAGHNTRGGFQGRSRGAYNTSRGVRGGRGSYRQESRSWANVASVSVRSENCCRNILEGGPWYVSGFLLILKQWHRMMKLSKEDKSTIPVWVKFYNVPLEFWNGESLSRVASAVGVPLFMDQLTSSGNRVSFARVCVNIQADFPFPESFILANEGESVEVRVEYQGVPTLQCLWP
ncbi:hypothetical protein ACSBR2_011831 [Camellia fascicularis]